MSFPTSNDPIYQAPQIEPALPATGFIDTWRRAVTRPSRQTYVDIAAQPNASVTTAMLWVFMAALVEYFFTLLLAGATQQGMLRLLGGQTIAGSTAGSSGVNVLTVVCGAPVAAVVTVLSLLLFTGIVHLSAKAFGGKAPFGKLAFVFAAIIAPVALLSTVMVLLEAIPVAGAFISLCLLPVLLAVTIYVLVIEVIATGAVEQIGGGAATASVLSLLVLAFMLSCVVIAVLMVMGPIIGNTFSSINNSLMAP